MEDASRRKTFNVHYSEKHVLRFFVMHFNETSHKWERRMYRRYSFHGGHRHAQSLYLQRRNHRLERKGPQLRS